MHHDVLQATLLLPHKYLNNILISESTKSKFLIERIELSSPEVVAVFSSPVTPAECLGVLGEEVRVEIDEAARASVRGR
jgi:hypothetical protein